MKVRLEPDRCVGHAQCFAVDDVLFPVDDAGYSEVTVFEVTPENEDRVRRGVSACPEHALVIED